jgi:chemotaxis protein CheX
MASNFTDVARVVLAPQLDLTAATPLARELLPLRGRDVVIDASKVERVGVQCVQVLLSAAATWHADMMGIDLDHASPAFQQGLKTLGLTLSAISNEEPHQ